MMVRRCASLGEKTSSRRCSAATGRSVASPTRWLLALTATYGDLVRYGSQSSSRRASICRRTGQETPYMRRHRLRLHRRRLVATATSDDNPSLADSPLSTSETTQSSKTAPVDLHLDAGNAGSKEAQKITWGQLMPAWWRSFWATSPSGLYLRDCSALLRRNLLTLMSLTALNSGARFALVWILYKTVCAMAVQVFGIPPESIPQEMIPNPSSTSGDPNVYQQLADITFLLFKPFDFILRGIFIAAALLVCQDSLQMPTTSSGKKRFWWIRSSWEGFSKCFTSSWQSLGHSPRYLLVYIIMNAMTAFYQGLCLLLVPILFAVRKLMNIQLALCVALLQGKRWREALKESEAIVEPVRRHLYLPYFLLLLMPKLLGFMRGWVVKAFPDRLFIDVPEITWGLIAITTVVAFLMDRMAEIFPLVIYASTRDMPTTGEAK